MPLAEDVVDGASYLRKYNESYRGSDFIIIQEVDQLWTAVLTTTILMRTKTYKEAYAYACGYIDSSLEHLSEWSCDE